MSEDHVPNIVLRTLDSDIVLFLYVFFSKSPRDDSCMMGHINFTFRVAPDSGLAPYGSATAPLITYNETEAREP